MPLTLETLLAPVGRDIFEQRHWEHEPVVLRGTSPDCLAGLFDLDDADRIIHSSGLRGPTYRVVKDQQDLPAEAFSMPKLGWGSDSVTNFAEGNRLMAQLRDGASILFGSMHRLWGPVAEACRLVEETWGWPVAANGYLTPPRSVGFNAHWDYQSLLVLQTAGEKTWRLYRPTMPLPLKHQVCPPGGLDDPGELFMEVSLKRGDVLYVPRGWIHQAFSQEQTSLHVALSIMPTTWMDVFQNLLNSMADDVRFRAPVSIPITHAGDLRQVDEDRFDTLLAAFTERADADDGCEAIARRFVATRLPAMRGTLNELDSHDSVRADSLLRRRTGVIYRIENHGEQCHLLFQGQTMKLPWELVNAVRFVSEAAAFSPEQLPAEMPLEEKVAMCRSLLALGFLTWA